MESFPKNSKNSKLGSSQLAEQKMKRPADEPSSNPISPSKKSKVSDAQSQIMDLNDVQRKIKEKQETLNKIMAAKKKKAEREAAEKAQLELHSTIQEVHDEEVKAKGGLNVAYHPALAMSLDPKARLSKNRNDFLITNPSFATALFNQKAGGEFKVQPSLFKKKEIVLENAAIPDPSKNPYYDSSLKSSSSFQPQRRNRAMFKFNEPGKYVEQAEKLRKEQELDRLKQSIAEAARKAGIERDLALVSNSGLRTEPPPHVEWWDTKLLPNESYEDVVVENLVDMLGEIINSIVQHPVPIEPPLEEGVTVPIKPLLLTKMERKKLRRQNRLEAQREKQDKIKLGLLPQDQPRITKSNFMRVLGQEAVLAPSMVEKEMARQVAERQDKHLKKIEEEKLTEEQKKAKKDRKLTEDTSILVHVTIYKITNLEHKQHLFKISKNAQQFKLTGVLLLNPVMNLVIVEGGPKGISAYKRLMMNRINWQDRPQDALPLEEPNQCTLVWEGQVKTRSFFHSFKTKKIDSVDEAKEFLESKGVVQYWNAGRTLVADAI